MLSEKDLTVQPSNVRYGAVASTFTLDSLTFAESSLSQARKELYSSAGPGYFIIHNFLRQDHVEHLRRIWTSPGVEKYHRPFRDKNQFYFGCPNYYSSQNGNKIFFNFLWATPLDELTYALTFKFQMLRTRLEGKLMTSEIFPLNGKSVSYRVVISHNSETWIAPHTDYYHPENPLNRLHDLTRLQGTLFLSEHGKDYSGGGFTLKTNQGQDVLFGVDVKVRPGDLVIWRYPNQHSVTQVRSRADQLGFMRILFPPEDIHPSAPPEKLGIKKQIARVLPTPVKSRIKRLIKR